MTVAEPGVSWLDLWIPACAGMTVRRHRDDGWWVEGMTGRGVEWAGDGVAEADQDTPSTPLDRG